MYPTAPSHDLGLGDTDSDDGVQCPELVALKPGETVGGHNPQALLAPFFGTWAGTLTWADGADPRTTRLTLTAAQDPTQPIYRNSCHGPDGAHTNANVTLVTDDGALDATPQGSADSILPEIESYQQQSGLFLETVKQADWNGTIASRILGLDRYTDGRIRLVLAWDWLKSQPASGVLSFTGTATATGLSETFAIATWTVD
jgi:hypothetical protein